ncbi:MAG: DUF6350 family protein [Actinomycetota bacterium]
MSGSLHLPQNWLRAAVAGAEAAVLTWLVAVLGALVTYVATVAAPGLGNATWSSTVAIGAGWWTTAFGGRVPIEEGTVALAPLGLTLLALVLLRGAMRRLAVDTLAGAAVSVGTFTSAVALLGLSAGRGSGVHVAGALAVGVLAAAWALRGHERVLPARLRHELERVPRGVRAGLDAAGVAVLASLLVGALLVVTAVVTSWGDVATIHDSLEPDVVSGIVLTLAQSAYLPNLALWALAWVAGPGFAVGEGTTFSALGSSAGLLPAIPVLGALPAPGTSLPWVLAAPALLGIVVGWWRGRRRPLPDRRDAALASLTLLLGSFSALAVLGTAASGPIGPGRMAVTGMNGPLVAILLAGGLTAGYALVLVARLPATRVLARRLWARGRGAAAQPEVSSAGPVSPATAATAPTAHSMASATTAPTALSPAEGAEPVR